MTLPRTRFEKKLGWFILAVVFAGCLLVLLPFMSSLIWAVVLCFSTWPIYSRLLHLLGGRRTLAALLISLGMFCVILLPFVIVGATLGDNIEEATAAVRNWINAG